MIWYDMIAENDRLRYITILLKRGELKIGSAVDLIFENAFLMKLEFFDHLISNRITLISKQIHD